MGWGPTDREDAVDSCACWGAISKPVSAPPYVCEHDAHGGRAHHVGEHIMWVSKQLGHTDWAFSARTYSRWIPDDAPEAGRKAVAAWSTSGQRTAAND